MDFSARKLRPLCVAAITVAFAGSSLIAQTTGASIAGTVRDASGAAIPGATITIIDAATNEQKRLTTDSHSDYTLLGLAPGSYRMTATAPGFRTYEQQGIRLDLDQHARQDITLEVGDVQQVVSVTADVAGLDPVTSTVSDEVNGTSLRDLPLNTRNPYQLVSLVPGFQGSTGDDYNSNSFSINGTRQGYTDVLVDGSPAGFPTVNGNSGIGVFPSIDAIGEYRILAQNYAAEYGRTAGGIVNVVYKSGANRFHGSLFEFLRNNALDANDYFSNQNGKALPAFHRNQYGGTFTGPIRRDKTFFLLNAELLRQNQFQSLTTTVPTAQQRVGDFSQTFASNGKLIAIYNPFTTRQNPNFGQTGQSRYIRDAFAGNVIPSALWSKVAASVMQFYPQATSNGDAVTHANNYFASGSTITQTTAWDVRVDHNLTDTQKIFARYANRYYSSAPNALFPQNLAVAEGLINGEDYARGLTIGYTNTLNPHTIWDTRLGFARTLYNYLNTSLGYQASSLGLPSTLNAAGGTAIFPTFGASGYTTLGNEGNRHNAFMSYSLLSSITVERGSHIFKAGFDGRLIRVNDHESNDSAGLFNFSQSFTQGPDPQTANINAGNSIASLLLGTGTGDLIQNFKDDASQSYYFAGYLQDDWHIVKTLTLNLGVRYDIDTPRTERYNRMNYFDPNAASPLQNAVPGLKGGLVFVGVDGKSRHQYHIDNNNLAPRFGFAWSATPSTVVHGGASVVYGPSAQAAAGTVGPYGFRVQNTWASSAGNDGITPLNTLDNPFPQGFSAPPGASAGLLTGIGSQIEGAIQNTPTPYAEQWVLDVQQALGKDVTINMTYVGNRGRKQQQSREGGIDYDQLPASDLSYGSSLSDQVANPYFGVINVAPFNANTIARSQLLKQYSQFTSVLPLFLSGGNTQYDAFQFRANKRFSRGLQVQASYTWARNFDNGTTHQDSFHPMADFAVSSQDVRNRFVASYIYDLPFGRGRRFAGTISPWQDILVGGWAVNGVTTIQGGTPLQITASNVSGLGNPTEYANWDGQNATLHTDLHTRLNRSFDTTHFSQPKAFTLGNGPAYYNTLRGPGLNSTDLSLFKDFGAAERVKLQFRAEAFNVFNHVQFSNPNTSVASTSFGAITSQANNPRQLQFGLKLLF
ncbi:TonB-dependent receptor [Terriglobus roseus]|uniref:TonB-dependent Receptor Plug Domain n=1 Tax=Terriglobus roseus TaxID=392734 RepID=A0A1H4IU53_9BACT|nr:TonB-dependent receptor [Terriglobus roseus]SEB37620.1 TonB-dependent Receptor Plug Domain [Terriglobus roseus]